MQIQVGKLTSIYVLATPAKAEIMIVKMKGVGMGISATIGASIVTILAVTFDIPNTELEYMLGMSYTEAAYAILKAALMLNLETIRRIGIRDRLLKNIISINVPQMVIKIIA